MFYQIEVNVARKHLEPSWVDLVNENDNPLTWPTIEQARAALQDEGRGDNARIVQYVEGHGTPV